MPGQDVAVQAEALADLYLRFSDTVRSYRRTHFDELPENQRAMLQMAVQHFEDLHDSFTAEAIEQRLQAVAGQLAEVTRVTQDARHALQTLKTITLATQVVSLTITLGERMLAGDPVGAAEAVMALGSLVPNPDEIGTGAG